jgi:CubicO group peptidase (beta-lactamase class C family)
VLARRILIAVVFVAASVYVHCAPRSSPPDRFTGSIDVDMPRASIAPVDAPDSLEELQRRLTEVLKEERAAGAVVGLVGREGPIWIGGLGLRDVAKGAPMQPDTVFRVGSVSKSLIALGVMRLHEQGKLDIDAPLQELLPGTFENAWEAEAPVTLAQCLEHTAGFDDIRFNEIFTDDEWLPVRDALAINPRSRIVRWRPGTRHGYSNVGYSLAGRAIEAASGEPFDVYLRREILAPMGILDADFGRTTSIEPRLAIGYQDGKPQAFHPFVHRPSGSLLFSAEDLSKFVHFWIRRGGGFPPIISAEGLARIERSGTLPYPLVDNQYGLANYADVSHPTMSHGHDGGMPGFHASYRYFSDLGVGYVMLLNANYTFRGYVKLRALLYAYLTRGRTATPPTRNIRERPGADYFQLANPRSQISGFIERTTEGWSFHEAPFGLHARTIGGIDFELHSMPDGSYRFDGDCGSSVRFTQNLEGKPIVVMSFMYGEAASYWPARIRFLALDLTMVLLALAPLWGAIVLLASWMFGARLLPHSLVVPPAITGIACFALPRLLEAAFDAGVIGIVHPLTVGAFAMTIVLAVSSVVTLGAAIRWMFAPRRPHALVLVIPTLFGVAFTGFSLWLFANGWIGLRTWAF